MPERSQIVGSEPAGAAQRVGVSFVLVCHRAPVGEFIRRRRSGLDAPSQYRLAFDGSEEEIVNDEADHDDGQQASEYRRDFE
jgi:hypothetical protein